MSVQLHLHLLRLDVAGKSPRAQTVEGLSIAAISYYALGLVVYALKAAKASGLSINIDIATGLAIPVVVGAVAYFTSRIRRQLHQK